MVSASEGGDFFTTTPFSIEFEYGDDEHFDCRAGYGFPNDDYSDCSAGGLLGRYSYETYSDGRVSEYTVGIAGTDSDGSFHGIDHWETAYIGYDEEGMVASCRCISPRDGTGFAAEYSGALLNSYYRADGWDEVTYYWTYDSGDNPSHVYITEEPQGQTVEYELIYDRNGNISEMRGIGGGAQGHCIEFEWVYFDDPSPLTQVEDMYLGILDLINWDVGCFG